MKITTHPAPDGTVIDVEYDEHSNSFSARLPDETVVLGESLAKVREKIDRRLSPKAKARRIPCFSTEGGSGSRIVDEGVATSIDERGQFARVTFHGGSKQVSPRYLFAHTPENAAIRAELAELAAQLAVIVTKQTAAIKRLQPFDVALLKD